MKYVILYSDCFLRRSDVKTAAVICELNPFHNGHALLFRLLREEYKADFIIALMSGNYVQRGEPAVFDKYVRAEMALRGGADMVIELPAYFSAASAHEFAASGVHLAAATGITDLLGFGTEAPATLEDLKIYAQKMEEAENGRNGKLKDLLSTGMSYPAALSELLGEPSLSPNNILAVEYLRALSALGSGSGFRHKETAGREITPVAVCRRGDGYHDKAIRNPRFTSATALRESIYRYDGHPSENAFPFTAVPESLHPLYCRLLDSGMHVHPDDLSLLLSDRLLTAALQSRNTAASSGRDLLSIYPDVSEEIAGRLLSRALCPMSFTERIADTKTRQYTYSRISRALLHLTLGITKDSFDERKAAGYHRYIRILGFRKDAGDLMRSLKQNASLPLITKPADHKELLKDDLYADQIYYSVQKGIRHKISGIPEARVPGEFMHSPVIV